MSIKTHDVKSIQPHMHCTYFDHVDTDDKCLSCYIKHQIYKTGLTREQCKTKHKKRAL